MLPPHLRVNGLVLNVTVSVGSRSIPICRYPSVPGHAEIFAIGDTSLAFDASGDPPPGVAPVAKQQGAYVAKLIKGRLRGSERTQPFRYRNYGNLATIGRKA